MFLLNFEESIVVGLIQLTQLTFLVIILYDSVQLVLEFEKFKSWTFFAS